MISRFELNGGCKKKKGNFRSSKGLTDPHRHVFCEKKYLSSVLSFYSLFGFELALVAFAGKLLCVCVKRKLVI